MCSNRRGLPPHAGDVRSTVSASPSPRKRGEGSRDNPCFYDSYDSGYYPRMNVSCKFSCEGATWSSVTMVS